MERAANRPSPLDVMRVIPILTALMLDHDLLIGVVEQTEALPGPRRTGSEDFFFLRAMEFHLPSTWLIERGFFVHAIRCSAFRSSMSRQR